MHYVSDVSRYFAYRKTWQDSGQSDIREAARTLCTDKGEYATKGLSSLVDWTSESYTRGTHSSSQAIHESRRAKVPRGGWRVEKRLEVYLRGFRKLKGDQPAEMYTVVHRISTPGVLGH
jgi:hypothetical protein